MDAAEYEAPAVEAAHGVRQPLIGGSSNTPSPVWNPQEDER